MKNNEEKIMSLSGHLHELRSRLIISILALVLATGISLIFAKNIFYWLQLPLLKSLHSNSSFVALNPIEVWIVYFKISLLTALFATSPIWSFQFWAYIAPGLKKDNRRRLIWISIVSAILFCAGGAVCYFLILPIGFNYFVSLLDQTNIVLLPQIQLYLGFTVRMIIAFGFVFQLPLIVVALVKWKILTVDRLKKMRPYIIVFSFVTAAIITPPDVFTQIIVALPLILLFETTLLISRIIFPKNQ